MAAVLSAAGLAGPPAAIGGDLLGVDASGHAVTVQDNGHLAPSLLAYGLNDSSFWTA
jgi:hypothetical protein